MIDFSSQLVQKHDFLVCVDSDGCVFDNMELKHKECFCPATVNAWGLQGVSRYAREAAEFVNLYSVNRGINRFLAIIKTLDLTVRRKQVRSYNLLNIPDVEPLKEWISETPTLSASALEEYILKAEDAPPVLRTALRWSKEVDANIERIVHGVRPFPNVREALLKLSEFSDIIVVSATPHDALTREWIEAGIADCVSFISGQEMGSKAECIKTAMKGRYAPNHVLKIGDAPGDEFAAKENGVLFSPIIPGKEVESWDRIISVDADRLINGTFDAEYAEKLCKDFYDVLLTTPLWSHDLLD